MPPVTFQNNTIKNSKVTVNLNGSNYVENFTEVESIIEQLFPENLQRLLIAFGNIVKSDLSISNILSEHSDELLLPDVDTERKLDLLWQGWYLFLIYITINNGSNSPEIGDYKIQLQDNSLKIKHIFYLGNKNFEELVAEFLRNESAMDKVKYDLYIFNNKRGGLYPPILPATRKSKIITDIAAIKSLSEELTGVKESGFMSLHKIHDVLSDITEEDIGVLKDEVNRKIQEVCKNAIS
jgi:hypothetical protein